MERLKRSGRRKQEYLPRIRVPWATSSTSSLREISTHRAEYRRVPGEYFLWWRLALCRGCSNQARNRSRNGIAMNNGHWRPTLRRKKHVEESNAIKKAFFWKSEEDNRASQIPSFLCNESPSRIGSGIAWWKIRFQSRKNNSDQEISKGFFYREKTCRARRRSFSFSFVFIRFARDSREKLGILVSEGWIIRPRLKGSLSVT